MLALVVCLLSAACSADERLQGFGPGLAPPTGPVRPMVSAAAAAPGTPIAIAIATAPGETPVLAGVLGELRYDPATLRYLGQAQPDSLRFPLVVVNDARAGQGVLRVLSLDPHGLAAQSAVLAFEVRASDYTASLRYALEQAVTTDLQTLPSSPTPSAAGVDGSLVPPRPAVRLTAGDWQSLEKQFRAGRVAGLIDSVPAGRRYGDIDSSGSITIVDASRVSSWAVGNQAPPGQPIPAPGGWSS